MDMKDYVALCQQNVIGLGELELCVHQLAFGLAPLAPPLAAAVPDASSYRSVPGTRGLLRLVEWVLLFLVAALATAPLPALPLLIQVAPVNLIDVTRGAQPILLSWCDSQRGCPYLLGARPVATRGR